MSCTYQFENKLEGIPVFRETKCERYEIFLQWKIEQITLITSIKIMSALHFIQGDAGGPLLVSLQGVYHAVRIPL